VPLKFSSDLLVVLYWIELLTQCKLNAVVTFLQRLRTPFIVFVCYYGITDTSFTIVRAVYSGSWPTVVTTVNMLVAVVVILVACCYLLYLIHSTNTNHAEMAKRLRKAKNEFLVMTFFTVCLIIVMIIYQFLRLNPWTHHYIIAAVSITMACMSLSQTMMFGEPLCSARNDSKSSSEKEKTRKSKSKLLAVEPAEDGSRSSNAASAMTTTSPV